MSHRAVTTDRVSIVIPVRNDARYLRRCLDALLRQTRAPYEVIVVDNGSTDGSAAVAWAAGAVVVHEPVAGIPRASAAGYDAASGDIIARLDADSIPGVLWVSSVVEVMHERPELAAVTGRGILMEDDGRPHRRSSAFFLSAYFWSVGFALGHPPLWGSAFAMRRESWRAVREHVCRTSTRIHDDMDLSVHLGPIRSIDIDDRLSVAVSARPLALDGSTIRRFARGFTTVLRHWPVEFPPFRVVRRLVAGSRAHRDAVRTATGRPALTA